jgi:hypothetical protein
MKFFFILAVIAAGLIWGTYFALIQVGLIDEGCPAVSSQGGQVVIDNQLDLDLRIIMHDSSLIELRVPARQCMRVNIDRLKVAVESWEIDNHGVPNCVADLLPAQRLVVYRRGAITYCDVARAEIDLDN